MSLLHAIFSNVPEAQLNRLDDLKIIHIGAEVSADDILVVR